MTLLNCKNAHVVLSPLFYVRPAVSGEGTRFFILLDCDKGYLQQLFRRIFIEQNTVEGYTQIVDSMSDLFISNPAGTFSRTWQKSITLTKEMDLFLGAHPKRRIFIFGKSDEVWGFREYNREFIKPKTVF